LVWEARRLGESAWIDPDTGAYTGRARSTFYTDCEAATPRALAAMPTLLCCMAESLAGGGGDGGDDAANAAHGRELAAWLRRLRHGGSSGVDNAAPMPATRCAFLACRCRSSGGVAAAAPPPALKRCSRCHEAYYCSKEAQRADWARHKAECRRNHDGDNRE
jgi:hypothetical protein